MEALTLNYLSIWHPLGLFILLMGLLIEGNIFLFAAMFLTQRGAFTMPEILPIVLVGILGGDFLWYLAGRYLTDSDGRTKRWVEKLTKSFDKQIGLRPNRVIFFSKFIYGIHRAVLVRAGMLKISFKKFLIADGVTSVMWIILIGGVAYVASSSLSIIKHYLKFTEIALLVALLGFLFIEKVVSRFFKEELESDEKKDTL